MGVTLVDIGIPAGYVQHYQWWSEVMSNLLYEVQMEDKIQIGQIHVAGTALPDRTKNAYIGAWLYDEERRNRLTDMNRNKVVGINSLGDLMPDGFMSSDAEWIFWIDDDTVPPKGVIGKLLDLQREVVSGMYFMGGEPYNPLAYMRGEDGFYKRLNKYTRGMLMPVDSIGLGCCLVHKSVYERITEAHVLYQRPNGTLLPVPRAAIVADPWMPLHDRTVVVNDTLIMPLSKPDIEDNRPYPFHAMEYNRTEDHHFCELCANAGVQIYLDTTIVCQHWKHRAITEEDFWKYLSDEERRKKEKENAQKANGS